MHFGVSRAFLVLAVSVAILAPSPVFSEGSSLVLSPARWEFGSIRAGTRAFLTLQVANTASRPITVTIIPTCDCLSTSPSEQVVPAGKDVEFSLSFLAEQNEAGFVRESYIVLTDCKRLDHFYYWAHGCVVAAGAP